MKTRTRASWAAAFSATVLALAVAGLLALTGTPTTAQQDSVPESATQQEDNYYTMNPWATSEPHDPFGDGKIRLVIRLDDMGMNHAVNQSFKQIAETGKVSAVSILVNTPWLDEAVELAKQYPDISYGVHTCLNSEWVPYRWGPVLPPNEVPSLVDEWGKFHGTRADLLAGNPDPDEMEREIRAQIDLALAKGLNISYLDHHMGAAVSTPEFRERFERIAEDYGLAVSRWFGEAAGPAVYPVEPEKKLDFVLDGLRALEEPGIYLMVMHPALDVPEMRALTDLNPTGLDNMPAHRQAETDLLMDARLAELLEERGIELVGYDVLRERFLEHMTPPYGN